MARTIAIDGGKVCIPVLYAVPGRAGPGAGTVADTYHSTSATVCDAAMCTFYMYISMHACYVSYSIIPGTMIWTHITVPGQVAGMLLV